MWSDWITPEAATTATEHLIEQGFEAILFLSEPLGMVNTRRDRLGCISRHAGALSRCDRRKC